MTLADRTGLRPGTRLREALRDVRFGSDPGCRESFFKFFLRDRIGPFMLRPGTQVRITQPMQQAPYPRQRIRLTKFPFQNPLNDRSGQDTHAVDRQRTLIQTSAKFRFTVPRQSGGLPRPGFVTQFLQAAAIVPGHPLLNGSPGGPRNRHDLGATAAHLSQIDALNPTSQPGVLFRSIVILQLSRRMMGDHVHNDLHV